MLHLSNFFISFQEVEAVSLSLLNSVLCLGATEQRAESQNLFRKTEFQ